MTSNIVKNWFRGRFKELAPQLQNLHIDGGKLSGDIEVRYGEGIAGILGKRLAKKLNIPETGTHQLIVNISHHKDGLHWDRIFNDTKEMKSTFEPIGNIEDGFWIEKTGPLNIKLTVDIKEGGWHWRCLSFSFWGIPLPAKLFPESEAYKKIENEQYRFYVGFKLWFFGELLSYGGLLNLEKNK